MQKVRLLKSTMSTGGAIKTGIQTVTRLPKPGGDKGSWGDVLNDYLLKQHRSDGSHDVSAILHIPNQDGTVLVSSANAPDRLTWQTLTKQHVGLHQVDDTADVDKPISIAAQAALDQRVTKGSIVINAMDYGAVVDGIRLTDVSVTTNSAVVVSAMAHFTQADVGKLAIAFNDSNAGVATTIASVQSATQCTLASPVGMTSGGGNNQLIYGTNDAPAIQAALSAAGAALSVPSVFDMQPNQPVGLGMVSVVLPAGSGRALAMIGATLNVPAGVRLRADAMVGNAIPDRYAYCITMQHHTALERLHIENAGGTGVLAGEGNQALIYIDELAIWHTGEGKESSGQLRSQDALVLNGYEFVIQNVWIKRGRRGIVHAPGHDTIVANAFVIGMLTGVYMELTNQTTYNNLYIDSCKGNGAAQGYGGVVMNNGCCDISIKCSAFTVANSANICNPLISIGQLSSGLNKFIRIEAMANNTGGEIVRAGNVQDLTLDVLGSNVVMTYGANNPITTAIAYTGNLLGAIDVRAGLSSSITASSGTIVGTLNTTVGNTLSFQNGIRTNGLLTINNGMILKRSGVGDTNYTVLGSDYVIAYTALTAPRTVTLPAASANNANQTFIIKDQTGGAGTHTITVVAAGGQTIDGQASKIITTAYGTLQVYNNGATWYTL